MPSILSETARRLERSSFQCAEGLEPTLPRLYDFTDDFTETPIFLTETPIFHQFSYKDQSAFALSAMVRLDLT
jgi:hypothetical protein